MVAIVISIFQYTSTHLPSLFPSEDSVMSWPATTFRVHDKRVISNAYFPSPGDVHISPGCIPIDLNAKLIKFEIKKTIMIIKKYNIIIIMVSTQKRRKRNTRGHIPYLQASPSAYTISLQWSSKYSHLYLWVMEISTVLGPLIQYWSRSV